MDDASLVEALAGGDGDAARELYRRHSHAILRFAMAMTNSRATAEDIVHDTFVELLYRPRNFTPARGSLRAFLYGIARHRIANAARRLASLPSDPAEEAARVESMMEGEQTDLSATALPATAAPAATALTITPEDQTEHAQEIGLLRAAIGSLPLAYREVIAWCDLEEVPYATVADILGCPLGTVRSRLHRARALLSEIFQSLRHPGDPPRAPKRDLPDSTAGLGATLTPALKGGPT